MAEHSYFFNSINHDRKYKAEDWAEFFNCLLTNGIFPNPSTNLQVYAAGDDMRVYIAPGKAWINGHCYFNDSNLYYQLTNADGTTNRIDRLVVRLDTAGRIIGAQVKQGAYATSPTATAIQRDADVYELAVSDVYVGAGVTKITQSVITDTRLNTSLCGTVNSLIQADTTAIFNQYLTWLNEQKAKYANDSADWQSKMAADEAEFIDAFNTWFDSVKAALGADAAGNLLNLINDHKADDINHIRYGVTTNLGNDYSVTFNPAVTEYKDGLPVRVKINTASTAAATLNVNGLGAKAIYDGIGNAVTDLKANTPYLLCYESDSDHFIALGKGGVPGNGSQTYSTAGTYQWKVPPCVNRVLAYMVGGGGGGGGGVYNNYYSTGAIGGNGGGGAFLCAMVNVIPGTTISVIVGAGGTYGSGVPNVIPSGSAIGVYPAQSGTAGGASSFGSINVPGGGGGTAAQMLYNPNASPILYPSPGTSGTKGYVDGSDDSPFYPSLTYPVKCNGTTGGKAGGITSFPGGAVGESYYTKTAGGNGYAPGGGGGSGYGQSGGSGAPGKVTIIW